MTKYLNECTLLLSPVIGGLIGLFGGWDVLLQTMIILIVLDYGTGLLKAIYNKNLSSAIGSKGIIKKVMILIIIALASSLQVALDTNIPIREIVLVFFIVNEGLSILENAVAMGVPVPQKIVSLLKQIRDTNDQPPVQRRT